MIPPTPEHPHLPPTTSLAAPAPHRLRQIFLTIGSLAGLLAVALVIAAIVLRHDLRASQPVLDGTLPVSGLAAPVTITRDTQGVPSIHARTLDDLLFAQGYLTASDRLFQMDALRRHGAGTLAEILGPSLIPHDREQRYLQLRAAADRAITTLPPDQLHQLQAYANGVNAFISTHNGTGSHPNTLPIEFHLLDYAPDPWTPRDSLLIAIVMAQDLTTGFPTKLNREALATRLPASLLADLYPVGSWRDQPPTQGTPDLTTPSSPIEQIPLDKTQSSVSPADLLTLSADLSAHRCDGCRAGSNNWAVDGAHTSTGAPLLSNDMHLGLTAPDIWYEAALHADGPNPLNVEGFTLPGVPFVIVGRNANVAWGFTNSEADVQDILIEHLRGSGQNAEYERPDHTWAPVAHHPELIRVRAGRNLTLDVLTTTHTIGSTSIQTPIISPLLKSEHRSLALAWTLYDPSTLTAPMYAINTAADTASLVAAFSSFSIPSQNLIYADAHHIGYHLLGRIPIRGPAIQRPRSAEPVVLPNPTSAEDEADESGDTQSSSITPLTQSPQPQRGAVVAPPLPSSSLTTYTIGSPISPVPVDALDPAQAWSGYIPYDALPSVQDPASGILATANARITPDDYPYAVSLDWSDPYRVERIHHLLATAIASGTPLTPDAMLRIQTDVRSEFDLLVAQRLAYALDHSSLTHKDPRLLQAANLLRNWNGDLTLNSSAATIVAVVEPQLWPMLLGPQLQAYNQAHGHVYLSNEQLTALIHIYIWEEDRTALEQIIQNTPARWLPPAFANWNDFLTTAVERGLGAANAPHDLDTFPYGPHHPVDIAHPIFGSHSPVSTLLGVATGTGLHPNSGDATTIKATGHAFGPSERFTADLSNPDNTRANITTGESGNPASPWFLDQFRPWLNGTTFTLPLDHPTITHTLTLTPQ